jgi:hypothetical protein
MTTTFAAQTPGDAAEQQPPAALARISVCAPTCGASRPGDLAHRRQQRQRAVRQLDRLVGDAGDLAPDQLLGERPVGGEVQVCEERPGRPHPRVLLRDRLLDLEDEVARRPDVVAEPRIVAPAPTKSSSKMEDPSPAPFSRYTSCPLRTSSCTPAGVIATRYSWFLTSRGMPTFTSFTLFRLDPASACRTRSGV